MRQPLRETAKRPANLGPGALYRCNMTESPSFGECPRRYLRRVIERAHFDDVLAIKLSWWRSRVIGYSVHAYLVRGVLVDSGFPAAHRAIRRLVREMTPRGAMITHQHEDHAGNVELLASMSVPLAIGAGTARAISQPQHIGLYRKAAWTAMPPLRSAWRAFDDPALELVSTPGHSPDHHAVWDHHTDTLFAGDAFLGVKVRVAHTYEDPRAHVRSLRAMIERRPARMFCGHRGLVPDPCGALRAKANWMTETIGTIETLHASGVAISEIRQRVLGQRGFTHLVSAGDYSPDNIVHAVIRGVSEARP